MRLYRRLGERLKASKASILREWFRMVVETYPPDTSRFLKAERDPFANPVGSTTMKGLDSLFGELLDGMDGDVLRASLDPIIRIRAVQSFSPSQATGFVLFLKKLVREQLTGDESDPDIIKELLRFESDIDTINQIAFDLYTACRERLYQIRVGEERSRAYSALERAGLIAT